MKAIYRFPAVVAVALALLAPGAQALDKKGEVVMKQGSTVHLFHSGTADVREEICLNDVVPVYRELMSGGHTTSKKVGKVKINDYAGEHYFTATVVEGDVKPGDVVKKKKAACLVR